MANLTIPQTTESAALISEMCKLFEGETPERALKDCSEAFRALPDSFNALRNAINAANTYLKNYIGVYDGFVRTFGKSLGIGVTARIQAVGLTGKDLDDDAQFVEALKGVGQEKSLLVKMRTCIAMNDTLTSLMHGWESKLVKLYQRRDLAGSTEAEIAICERKAFAINEVVARLKQRGDAVSQIYYACKRELESFISASDLAFKPMFANESTGKNHDESGSDQGGEVK